MRLAAEDIARACSGRLVRPGTGRMARALAWDSRAITPDALYVALPGQRVDGHDFCPQAAQGGAAAILVSRELDVHAQSAVDATGAATVLVDDCERALATLASFWRGFLNGKVLALTGSSGKTTTKNLVRDVLARAGSVVATQGNQNNELGVPATLLAADADTRFIVVEMGMRGQGQIAALCDIARPDAALVTNVGSAHMELLGSREAIARAKCESFAALSAGGVAYVNAADCSLLAELDLAALQNSGVTCVFFDATGAHAHADSPARTQPLVWASEVHLDNAGCASFKLHAERFSGAGLQAAESESCACRLRLPGVHNVSNSCAAAAVGLQAGLSLSACCDALAASEPEAGRQSVVRAASGVLVFDDSYNANPDSVSASLASFAAMDVEGRRVAVLGDMYELGGFSDEGHALVGRLAAECGLDRLVCVGSLARGIAEAARASGMEAARIDCLDTAAQACRALRGTLAAGDAVLVKGSHSLGLDSLVESLVNEDV